MSLAELAQPLALTLLLGVAGGVVGSAIWWFARRNGLEGLPPDARLRRIVAIAVLPAAAGLLLTGIALLPSILDAAALASDHCHSHADHHFHLCFIHGTHFHASSTAWIPVALAAAWAAVRVGRTGLAHYGSRRWTAELREAAESEGTDDVRVLRSDRPFAATVGLADPEILISTSLRRQLRDEHRRAVEAHERTHAERRHGLTKVLVDLFAAIHVEPVRQFLRRELALACEQIADRNAAEQLGGAIPVAEAIVRVERLVGDGPVRESPEPRTAFEAGSVERRVVGLLEEPWTPARSSLVGGAWGVAIGSALVAHEEVHHGLETVLSWLIS